MEKARDPHGKRYIADACNLNPCTGDHCVAWICCRVDFHNPTGDLGASNSSKQLTSTNLISDVSPIERCRNHLVLCVRADVRQKVLYYYCARKNAKQIWTDGKKIRLS
jgi:hypothetical protein